MPSNISGQIIIQIDDREFRRLMDDRRFTALFNTHMSQQFLVVGAAAKSAIRREIDNTPRMTQGVWMYIKGHSRALYHTGSLRDGYTFSFRRSTGAVVGIVVKPVGTHTSGLPMTKIAELMINGASWEPSDKQRQAVAIAAQNAPLGAPPPEGVRKKIWTIPPHPFLRDALFSQRFLALTQRQALRALQRTFTALKQ